MKTIVITGGDGALGEALAKGLTDDFEVILLGLDEKKLEEQSRSQNCSTRVCDLRDNAQIEDTVRWIIEVHKKIDVLVNCAGVNDHSPIDEVDPSRAEDAFKVNALAPLLLARSIVPHMKDAGSGQIIDINSTKGLDSNSGRAVYGGSKRGMQGVADNLYQELAPNGIGVTSIHPGQLELGMSTEGEPEKRPQRIPHEAVVEAVRYSIKWYPKAHVKSVELRENEKI